MSEDLATQASGDRPAGSRVQGLGESGPRQGVIMAVDLGEKRIGLALSDQAQTLAFPHSVVVRTSRERDFARFREIITEQGVVLVVFGLPVTLGGREGERATWVRHYATDFQARLKVPVQFWDEALTTIEAEQSLLAAGASRKKSNELVDAVAASIILREYLAAHRER